MTKVNEITVRGMLALHGGIPQADIEHALHVLDPDRIPWEGTPETISFRDAQRLLAVTPHTVLMYADAGLLERAYPPGSRVARGITLDSYLAFSERATGRKPRTLKRGVESSVRFLLSRDATLSPTDVERGLKRLRGEAGDIYPSLRILTYREVAQHLRVTERTVRNYVHNGDLTPVRGSGRKAIGVTYESLLRMTSGRQNAT